MLKLLEKDYIIVELDKNIWQRWSVDCSPTQDNWVIHWLVFTIQCNGKLKKHVSQFRVKIIPQTGGLVSSQDKEIIDYVILYEAIELLNDLWYSIDRDTLIKDIELQIQ